MPSGLLATQEPEKTVMVDKQGMVGLNTIYNLLVIWHGNGNEYPIPVGLSGHWGNWPLDFSWLLSERKGAKSLHAHFSPAGWYWKGSWRKRTNLFKNTELVALKCMLLCCHIHWPVKSDREQNILVTLHLGDAVCGLGSLLLGLFKGKWLRSCLNLSELQSTTNFAKGFKTKNQSVSPLSCWVRYLVP